MAFSVFFPSCASFRYPSHCHITSLARQNIRWSMHISWCVYWRPPPLRRDAPHSRHDQVISLNRWRFSNLVFPDLLVQVPPPPPKGVGAPAFPSLSKKLFPREGRRFSTSPPLSSPLFCDWSVSPDTNLGVVSHNFSSQPISLFFPFPAFSFLSAKRASFSVNVVPLVSPRSILYSGSRFLSLFPSPNPSSARIKEYSSLSRP